MAKKVTVLKIANDGTPEDPHAREEFAATKHTLRLLKPLGIRFSVETVNDEETTISAWLEEKEPKAQKERQALGNTIPDGARKTERGDDRTHSHHPAPDETPIGSTPR